MLIESYIITIMLLSMTYDEMRNGPEDYWLVYFLGTAYYFEHIGAYT